jgi:hypothetical protein
MIVASNMYAMDVAALGGHPNNSRDRVRKILFPLLIAHLLQNSNPNPNIPEKPENELQLMINPNQEEQELSKFASSFNG